MKHQQMILGVVCFAVCMLVHVVVRQTCNLSYTVCVLMNVITHAQFDVGLFCSVCLNKVGSNCCRLRSSGLGSVCLGGVDPRIPHWAGKGSRKTLPIATDEEEEGSASHERKTDEKGTGTRAAAQPGQQYVVVDVVKEASNPAPPSTDMLVVECAKVGKASAISRQ